MTMDVGHFTWASTVFGNCLCLCMVLDLRRTSRLAELGWDGMDIGRLGGSFILSGVV